MALRISRTKAFSRSDFQLSTILLSSSSSSSPLQETRWHEDTPHIELNSAKWQLPTTSLLSPMGPTASTQMAHISISKPSTNHGTAAYDRLHRITPETTPPAPPPQVSSAATPVEPTALVEPRNKYSVKCHQHNAFLAFCGPGGKFAKSLCKRYSDNLAIRSKPSGDGQRWMWVELARGVKASSASCKQQQHAHKLLIAWSDGGSTRRTLFPTWTNSLRSILNLRILSRSSLLPLRMIDSAWRHAHSQFRAPVVDQ